MTNMEIKFELARLALEKCCFTTSETLTEGLKNLYEWVVEEPEVEVKENTQNEYNNITVSEILNCVRKNVHECSPVTEMLATVFAASNIKTVGDLLGIGRQCFKKYRNIGKKSLLALDDALAELGVKGW
jgi:DNA-directed RNA polymerase alpha subunit